MEIKIDNSPQDYLKSLKYMENRVNEIIKNQNDELAWLLSHPAIYTSGSTDHKSDLLNNNNIPCLLYTSPSPRDRTRSRMPSSA